MEIVYKYDLTKEYKKFPKVNNQFIRDLMILHFSKHGLPAKDGECRNYYAKYSEIFEVKLKADLYAKFRVNIRKFQKLEMTNDTYEWRSLTISDYEEKDKSDW